MRSSKHFKMCLDRLRPSQKPRWKKNLINNQVLLLIKKTYRKPSKKLFFQKRHLSYQNLTKIWKHTIGANMVSSGETSHHYLPPE